MQPPSPERSELNTRSDQARSAASSIRDRGHRGEPDARSRSDRVQSAASSTRAATQSSAHQAHRPSPARTELNTPSDVQSGASSTRTATGSRAQRAQRARRQGPGRSELDRDRVYQFGSPPQRPQRRSPPGDTRSDHVQSAASSAHAANKSRAQRAQPRRTLVSSTHAAAATESRAERATRSSAHRAQHAQRAQHTQQPSPERSELDRDRVHR